jgi:anti-sigma factor NepR-like protein
MSKRHHHPYARGGHESWSIGSNSLTPAGQSQLLKQIGRQLQTDYQHILKEPAPDRIKQLLERLENDRSQEGDEPL